MKSTRSIVFLPAIVCGGILMLPASARADDGSEKNSASIKIDCSRHDDPSSINAALAKLDMQQSAILTVSGTCKENVVIQGFNQLVLKATAGASIVDPSGGAQDTVTIVDSRSVSLQGFTISGGADGVFCQNTLVCNLQGNTIQNSLGNGVTAAFSRVTSTNDVIQGHAGFGLYVLNASTGAVTSDTIRNNQSAGITVQRQSYLRVSGTMIANSGFDGIGVLDHSTITVSGGSITGSSGRGIHLGQASEASFPSAGGPPVIIQNNFASGVQLNDLSFASFLAGGSIITNNNTGHTAGTFDVTCKPQFSATRGALTQIGGGTTNCVEP